MGKKKKKYRGTGSENKQRSEDTDFIKICLEVRREGLLPLCHVSEVRLCEDLNCTSI